MLIDPNALAASICRDSFFEFFKEFWPVISPQKIVMNWHIPYICGELQKAAERVIAEKPRDKDIVCNVSPGSTKSSLFSVAFPAWVWTKFPQARMICGSFTDKLAMDLSLKCRDIVTSDKYKLLFPDVELRADQNTKGFWANNKGGMRYSVGVGGSVTGMHAHFLIVDDPIDPMSATSDDELDTANRWMSETLPSRKVDKEVAVMFLVMQRLNREDPTGLLLQKSPDMIHHICLPAIESDDVRPAFLRGFYQDGMMDPRRLSQKALDDQKQALGAYGFASQYMQTPIPLGAAMFLVDRLQIHDKAPDGLCNYVRYWDKAGSAGKGCYSVGVKMAITKSQGTNLPEYWILDVVRGQWDSDTRERKIVATAKADGVGCRIGVEQEPADSGKESAEATLRRLSGFRAFAELARGDKELRADTFSTQVNAGAVHLLKAHWNHEFIEELKYFPHSRFKDQVDAAAGAFRCVAKKRMTAGVMF